MNNSSAPSQIEDETEQLRCTVMRITYTSEETGWTVLKVRANGYSDLVAVVGNMGSVNVGSILTIKGKWVTDNKYGRQFSAAQYEESLPATVLGIEKYLGSGLIKGVGPKFAKRIVKTFGDKTLEIIENDPGRLIEVPGIGQARVDQIIEAWQEQREVKNIMLFLQEHDVGASSAYRIYNEFGDESITVVKENPYRLTEIWGIGFITADTIAQKMGYDKESVYRCRSGVLYTLSKSSDDGHCYLPRAELVSKAAQILDVDEEKAESAVDELLSAKELILDPPDSLYIPPLFFSENGTARRIRDIISCEPSVQCEDGIAQRIKKIEEAGNICYDDIQKEAINTASSSKIMILTGGPGTGKTTTVKGIIEVFKASNMKILLAAPTGRAAKRLNETTGMEAKTIHRLLEAKPPDGYNRNEDNKLAGDVLIVDESSMIDILLMYNLLKAVPDEMRLIFVGDAEQLPSVGPGNVLKDLIESGVVPAVKLNHIFRQAMMSKIITNAHLINKGDFPELKIKDNSDFFLVEEEDNAAIPGAVAGLCAKRLPGYFKVAPSAIQVLCPMQKGDNGALNLNKVLQEALNKSRNAIHRGGIEYRQGDKVMQQKNNYDKEVWNGDIGIITNINENEKTVEVSFDGGEPLHYNTTQLDELALAYATTVHKAQGSEYDIVVLPLTMQHYKMLQRNLLYTAITRARKAVVLVGTKKAIKVAIDNDKVTERNTGLAMRLCPLRRQI